MAGNQLLTYAQPYAWGNRGGTYMQTPNVQWQNTSSNATYCSAASALSVP